MLKTKANNHIIFKQLVYQNRSTWWLEMATWLLYRWEPMVMTWLLYRWELMMMAWSSIGGSCSSTDWHAWLPPRWSCAQFEKWTPSKLSARKQYWEVKVAAWYWAHHTSNARDWSIKYGATIHQTSPVINRDLSLQCRFENNWLLCCHKWVNTHFPSNVFTM